MDILFFIWDMGESVLLIANALEAINAGIALTLGIVSLVFALGSFVETILLMDAYQNGNEQAGQELIKNSMINIGVTMATAALRHLAKPVVKYAAKNKLVREFGEEFVEKLAEHTDDFAGVKKGIRKLQKLGVSDDILREMGERFGTDGYDWLLKKRPLGLDNDILRKLTQADNLMDYSDELLDAVKNSDGHADDIIKAVSTYGDDAADAIVKYGDDAADIIAKHGEDGLSWIKKYEKDAIDVIQEYGDEAVDSLKKGMTPDEIRLSQDGRYSAFISNLDGILEQNGITLNEFNSLRLQDAADLTDTQKNTLKSIRESVPMPDEDTLMQKVIPASDIEKYINGTYTQVGGYVTRAVDVAQLSTYDDFYSSLLQDYPICRHLWHKKPYQKINISETESISSQFMVNIK